MRLSSQRFRGLTDYGKTSSVRLCSRSTVKDFKKLPYHFSNESGEVRSHLAHLGAQVLLELQPVGGQGHHSVREALDVDQVDGRDVHACRDTERATEQLGDGEGLQRACAGWMCACVSRQDPQRGVQPLLQVYERAALPPCVITRDNCWSKVGKKGASWRLNLNTTKLMQRPELLTHGGARRIQDGLCLGVVHHHLLQAV